MKLRWPSKESVFFGLCGWAVNAATGTPIGTFLGKGSELAYRSHTEVPSYEIEGDYNDGEQLDWFNFQNAEEMAKFEQRCEDAGVPIVDRDGRRVAVPMMESHKVQGGAFEGQDAVEVGVDLTLEGMWN